MPWLILLASAVFEAIWATALGHSDGFTRLGPTLVFLIANVISMIGLAHAARSIPIGIAYAVWTGVGASLTVAWAMATGTESASPIKVLLIGGIIVAVLGLRLTEAAPPARQPRP